MTCIYYYHHRMWECARYIVFCSVCQPMSQSVTAQPRVGTEWKMERNNESRAYSNFNYFLDNKLMIFRNELCAKWMIILVT